MVDRGHRRRLLNDGGGLPPPGRRRPEDRRDSRFAEEARELLLRHAMTMGLVATFQETAELGIGDEEQRRVPLTIDQALLEATRKDFLALVERHLGQTIPREAPRDPW